SLDAPGYIRWPVLLTESRTLLDESDVSWNTKLEKEGFKIVEANKPDWLASLQKAIGRPSVTIDGPPTVRAIVHDQTPPGKVVPARTIVHLYNLNVQRLSSFEDKVTPATNIKVTVLMPIWNLKSVRVDSADPATTAGAVPFSEREIDGQHLVT